MRILSRRLAAVAVLAAVAAGTPPAQAGSYSTAQVESTLRRLANATDRGAAYDRLDLDLQRAVVDYLTPVNVPVMSYCDIVGARGAADPVEQACDDATLVVDYGHDPGANGNAGLTMAFGQPALTAKAADGCIGRWATFPVKNKFSRLLFAWQVYFETCYDGTVITSHVKRNDYPTIYTPFWFDRGNTGGTPTTTGGVGQRFWDTHTLRKFELCFGKCLQQAHLYADTSVVGTGWWRWEMGG